MSKPPKTNPAKLETGQAKSLGGLNKAVAATVFVFLLYLVAFLLDVIVFYQFVQGQYQFEVGLFRKDATKSYALTPSFDGFLYHRAGKTPVSVNSHGFRGPEWTLDKPFKVMVVGDSMTFGIPLAYEDGFVAKAKKKIGADSEFLNFGVPGYGTAHILEVMRENCIAVSPRHVFYMYFLNDTANNNKMGYHIVHEGYLVPSINKDGKKYSREFLSQMIQQKHPWDISRSLRMLSIRQFLSERGLHPRQLLEQRLETYTDRYTDRYIVSAAPEYSVANIRDAARDIQEMANLAKACRAEFTMITLTSYVEAYYGIIEPATQRLLEFLGSEIEIIDSRKFTRKGVNLTQWYDGHYGPAGTDLVSNVLAGYILGRYPELERAAASNPD